MTYSGKTKAALNAVQSILAGIAGTQATSKGIPESLANRVTAAVTVGDQRPSDKAAGYHETEVSFFIEFAYRVQGAEATAEDTIADWVDALKEAWLADRRLGGVVRTSELDFSLTREPLYRGIAGKEHRIYPVIWKTVIPR